MIVKGRVIPRPRVETAVVESSHRPGVGRAAQKLRSVSFSWGAGVVPSSCSVWPRVVSDMPSTVPRGTDTDRPDSRPSSATAGWRAGGDRRAARHPGTRGHGTHRSG